MNDMCKHFGHEWVYGRQNGVSLRICRNCGVRQACFTEDECKVWRDDE